ncbi:uncharacterized protein VP01_533g2 [Puccinia sorghi]|uniref:Uncharacterized protein n=1 Tax=Puccinia sorghi TaxID=27349 RepID=A0A0L6UK44_9BASI|nr:uncharacterized protein VP01_533g2 [Puccinia sorghi]
MSSVRFAPTHERKTHFRFPSIPSCTSSSSASATVGLLYQEPITRPQSTQPHSITNQQPQRVSHQGHHTSEKPRPSSISKIPTAHQHLLPPSRPSNPPLRPRTQSLTHQEQRNWLLPNRLSSSRTPSPSPSPSPSRLPIAAIKKSLIDTIDGYPCPLEDKLTLVAKLHAEVEAELTHLNLRSSHFPTAHHHSDRTPNPPYNQHHDHSRKEVEDTIRLIKHADRIKAHAIQQLKHDINISFYHPHQQQTNMQEQQDAAKCCEQYYTELSKAIELDFQKDHQRIEEDEEAIIMLLTLGYLGMPGSCLLVDVPKKTGPSSPLLTWMFPLLKISWADLPTNGT